MPPRPLVLFLTIALLAAGACPFVSGGLPGAAAPAVAATRADSAAAAPRADSAAAMAARPVGMFLRPLRLQRGAEQPRAASGPTGTASAPAVTASTRAASAVQYLSPIQIRRAYSLPARGARGQRVAIVVAGDDPYLQADLNAYDRQWGLPACTSANGCLSKLNESGRSAPLPSQSAGGGEWIQEAALGAEVVHGVCESCRLVLVEADAPLEQDFSRAIDSAAAAGATVIVTTFATPETNDDGTYVSWYMHPRAIVLASAGDATCNGCSGYAGEPDFPASLPYVLAVGGTDLRVAPSGAWRGESAWMGTVSGCSLYQPDVWWQLPDSYAVGCAGHRAVADMAAMSEPGAAIHVTGSGVPGGPWYDATGTSVSAPIVAAAIGLAGSMGERELPTLYARARSDPEAFHDIRSGANAPGCQSAICRAGKGYDGPTGLGTPFGLAAFLPSGGRLDRRRANVSVQAPRGGPRATRSGRVTLTVRNANPFAVHGSLTLQAAVRVGGRTRLVDLGSARLALAPLASRRVTVTIPRSERSRFSRLRSRAQALLRVAGPAGPAVSSRQRI
jgi:hypothetical protein